MNVQELLEDNRKLVEEFGASPVSELDDLPDFYTFEKGLIYSHRDFDRYMEALESGEDCAVVSGFNASGTMHLGHKAVFDTNLYFQQEHDVPVFIPISDDESYVTGKVDSQEEALENSVRLAREILAYGFDPDKTHFVIDQLYTDIYNLAVKYSRRVTLSEVRSTYGYKMEDNPGLFFYPAVQAAHILFPIEEMGFDNVLVPIGPDEDSHIRISRDIAGRENLEKPSILHATFMPGIDGKKMSASRNNTIDLMDGADSVKKKVSDAYSGGKVSAEEHREHGGDPEDDVPIHYLEKYFLEDGEAEELKEGYREGDVMTGEVKEMLTEELTEFMGDLQERHEEITVDDILSAVMVNEDRAEEEVKQVFEDIY